MICLCIGLAAFRMEFHNASRNLSTGYAFAGNVALCVKEISAAVDGLKATSAKGQQLTLPNFRTLAEAQATFQQARMLVARLESRIAEQCDPKRYPEGNTQPASAALSLLAEFQIHEDTVDILMCDLNLHLRKHTPCQQCLVDA
jgi:hypothetical protein